MTQGNAFAAVTRLYVSYRRKTHQSFDLNWALRNDEYAREIIRLAQDTADPELMALADRFADSRFGTTTPKPKPGAEPAAAPEPEPEPPAPSGKYVGVLR